MPRPVTDIGQTIARMADACDRANRETVRAATDALRVVVATNGRRFHIKGRSGTKVPLDASSNVKVFRSGPVGQVKGKPEGFWHIVEEGSSPHIIFRRKGGKVSLRGGNAISAYADGSSFGPLKLPNGKYAAVVHHPGHSALGAPWAQAMEAGTPIVERTLIASTNANLVRTFLGAA